MRANLDSPDLVLGDDLQNRVRLKTDRFAEQLSSRRLSQNAWAQRLGVSKAYLGESSNTPGY